MAKITKYLNDIKNAMFGKDVRSSIHNGIAAINEEVESTTSRQKQLEGTFDQLIINSGNSNAEIVAGRTNAEGKSFDTIGKRLDNTDSQIKENVNYLKDISVNVKMFGARGDGIIDDTIAIQNAFNYGNIIYFPPGQYKITSSITLPDRPISLEGIKRNSVLKIDDSVDILFKNVRRYSIFNNLDIHAKNKVFQGSLSYCEFNNVYINGSKSTSIFFEDTDVQWCGFITFNNCTFLNGKCVLFGEGSLNFIKFNDCIQQYMKYIICSSGSEAISFNQCNFEFMEDGSIFTSKTSGEAIYYATSFNNCYIENASILNMLIPAFNEEPQLKTTMRNVSVNGGWVYNSISLFNISTVKSSINYNYVSTMTETQTTELFKLNNDVSLIFKQGYCDCQYRNSVESQVNEPKNIIHGNSRNVVIISPTYKQWEVTNDVKFNNGIIFGSSLPRNNSVGAIVCNSENIFKATTGASKIPSIPMLYEGATLSELKAITNIPGLAFGLARDTKEMYYWNGVSWNKISFVPV